MNEATLQQFRDLADALSKREKIEIGIVTDKGTLTGVYDPVFKTVSVGGFTVPDKELRFWLHSAYGAKLVSIKEGKP
jgi:hypothetical protein